MYLHRYEIYRREFIPGRKWKRLVSLMNVDQWDKATKAYVKREFPHVRLFVIYDRCERKFMHMRVKT